MKRNLLILILVLVVLGVAGSLIYRSTGNRKEKDDSKKQQQDQRRPSIMNFDECVAAGNPVQESYPRKCTANGTTFTEDIGNAVDKQSLIRVTSPKPNELVKSPLTITGEARGTWFFEASFPVNLFESNGLIIGRGIAQTSANWMTSEFVPFTATVSFTPPNTAKGTIVLEKANPSDLDENSDSLLVPVKFK